jgi:hypothetical protein
VIGGGGGGGGFAFLKELSKCVHANPFLVILGMTKGSQRKDCNNEDGKEDMELPILFDLAVIAKATNNFSNNN